MKQISLIVGLVGLVGILIFSYFFLQEAPHFRVLETDFASLAHWQQAKLQPTFEAFRHSCDVFLKQKNNKEVGSSIFPLTVADWRSACLKARQLSTTDEATLRHFFETNFKLVHFVQGASPIEGTFTGYFLPLLKGSWSKTEEFQYPVYALPSDLISIDLSQFGEGFEDKKLLGRLKGKQLIPYHDRASINSGAIDGKSKPLLWVDNRLDRFFLEIQGSGYVDMTDGSRILLGYAGQNGRTYKSVGRYLVEQGAFPKEQASMQAIRGYLTEHPEFIDKTLNQNPSFIFFRQLDRGLAIGSQGAYLTPGYSLAVDKRYIPLGTPVWLETSYPDPKKNAQEQRLNRLMIAQDTGGAIKGQVRGDVFWGDLDNAAFIAGHMNQKGRYWLLLPKKKIG